MGTPTGSGGASMALVSRHGRCLPWVPPPSSAFIDKWKAGLQPRCSGLPERSTLRTAGRPDALLVPAYPADPGDEVPNLSGQRPLGEPGLVLLALVLHCHRIGESVGLGFFGARRRWSLQEPSLPYQEREFLAVPGRQLARVRGGGPDQPTEPAPADDRNTHGRSIRPSAGRVRPPGAGALRGCDSNLLPRCPDDLFFGSARPEELAAHVCSSVRSGLEV